MPDVRPDGFVDPPPGHGLSRYADQRLDWQTCGSLRCASLAVPLDYAKPDADAITLRLAMRPAQHQPASSTLLLNPGGPGGSGIRFLAGFRLAGLDGLDLVSWDPRGAGSSTPVRCWDDAAMDAYSAVDGSPDDSQERTILIDEERRFGLACLARSGPLLAHVSSAETVRDLDLIRSALGLATLNYLGYSNGTLLGAGYAQLFPRRAGRLVLDGAVNISGSAVSQPHGFERALDAMAGWCAARRCPLGSSRADVLASIIGFWTRLDAQPLDAGDRVLTQTLAVEGVIESLYFGEPGWSSIVPALDGAIHRGEPAGLLTWADRFTNRNEDGSYDEFAFAYPASNCADSPNAGLAAAEKMSAAENAQAPTYGRFAGPDIQCALWPVAPPPRLPRLTARDAPPLLVIGTTGDPATPYEWAQGMAHQLRSATLLTNHGEGHTSYADPACARVVAAFLVDGTLPSPASAC